MRTKNGHEVKVNDYLVHPNGELIKVIDMRSDLLWYHDIYISEDGAEYETTNEGMLTAHEVGKCLF